MKDISTVSHGAHPAGQKIGLDIGLLLGSGLYLYLNLFSLLGTPYLLGGDQVYFWLYAQRQLNGERIYRDFFQFTPPGTDLVYLSLFKLFGPRIWVTNFVVLVLGMMLCWLCFRISRRLMKEPESLLATALFLVLVYAKALNTTHHWFSAFAVFSALAVLMNSATPARTMVAGSLLGLASFFTQTRGVVALVGVAVFLLWKWSRTRQLVQNCIAHLTLLLLSYATTWALLSGYFIATIGLHQLLRFQITFAHHYVISGWKSSFGLPPDVMTWRKIPAASQYLFIYLLLPFAYGFGAWKCWYERRDRSFTAWDYVALLTLTGLAMMLEVAQSPNWLRLYSVAMPAIILFVWLLQRPGKAWPRAAGFMWICILFLAFRQTASRHWDQHAIAKLPAGTVMTVPATAEKLEWLAQHTQPGQFFFQPAWPGVYLPLEVRNPVFLDVLYSPDNKLPEDVEFIIQQLNSKGVQYILWSPRLNSPFFADDPSSYPLATFRDFLEKNYRMIQSFSDHDELWERRRVEP